MPIGVRNSLSDLEIEVASNVQVSNLVYPYIDIGTTA